MSWIKSAEKEAALELNSRPPHLSSFITEAEVQQHKTLVETYYQVEPAKDVGVAAPIRWQPYFKWVNSVRINHKNDRALEPKTIHIYEHWENDSLYLTGHRDDRMSLIFRDSNAKIKLSIPPKYQNVEDADFITINSLNSDGNYRFGSLFIQMAIEYSLMTGHKGKVRLNSTRCSGLFYFKLGFVPVSEHVFKRLKNGEKTDGWMMYLPQASIDIWKSKIDTNPILPNKLTSRNPALLQSDSAVNSSTTSLDKTVSHSEPPPYNANKDKIRQIINALINNIEYKVHNRASWFSYRRSNKIQKLKAIDSWLSSNNIDAINEMKVLSLVRDVSAIKRNPFGFFKPHSLDEFNEATKLSNLQCSDNVHFASSELNSIKEQSDVTKLLF